MALSAHSDMKVTNAEPQPDGDGDTARAGSGRTTLKVLGGLVLVTLLAGGIWIGLGDKIMGLLYEADGNVPVITADPSPIKVRPENPGGMQVPNQGRLVYGVVDGSASQPRVERLLPSPDKPMEVEQVLKRSVPEASEVVASAAPRGTADATAPRALIPATPPKPLSTVPSAKDVASLQPPPPAPAPSNNAQTATSTAPAPPPVPSAVATATPAPSAPSALAKTVAPPPAPEAKQMVRATPAPAAPATDMDKAYRIQLAAARSEEAVESEWNNLRRRHVDLLGELQLQIMKIDLGATKGVFYRLRAGPLSDEPTAKTLCERLKQRKLGCLVVKPGA